MGRAAAEVFAQEGARTAVLARGKAGLDEAVAALTALGAPDAVGLAADLTDRAQVDAAFAAVGERWGGPNVLVNAAGPVDVGTRRLDDRGHAEWQATFGIATLRAIPC